MTVPNPKTWVNGLVSSAELNQDIFRAYEFLLRPPLLVLDTPKVDVAAIPAGAVVDWERVVYDTRSMVGTTYVNSDVAVNALPINHIRVIDSGYYLINAYISWAGGDEVNTVYRRMGFDRVEGSSNTYAREFIWSNSCPQLGGRTNYCFSTVMYLDGGNTPDGVRVALRSGPTPVKDNEIQAGRLEMLWLAK